jgi:aminoacyl tRNA synthase complex-interacting multifunctional protein 1
MVGVPEKQLNSKKKVWETIQPLLRTTDKKEASFQAADGKVCLLRSETGVCAVKTVIGGSIK